jgi:hypothetical protein
MFNRIKSVKVDEVKFNKLISDYKSQIEEIEDLKKQLKLQKEKYSSEIKKMKKELNDINSLDINTSTLEQRNIALEEIKMLKFENKSLKSENKMLKISNESNTALLTESLITLRNYSDNIEDKTYVIDTLC